MILSPDQLHMQQSEVWRRTSADNENIADRPLFGNWNGSSFDRDVGDCRLSALFPLSRQAAAGGKENVGCQA
ncbi:hypothetical protein A0U90_14655 (plasmid) [Kozakia baliensis]|nr:hypothetical protein A0U90_14655 [Kozakia baliensis]